MRGLAATLTKEDLLITRRLTRLAAVTVLATGVTLPLTALAARADLGDADGASAAAAAACGSIGVGAAAPGGAGGLGNVNGGDGGDAAGTSVDCAAAAAPGLDVSGDGDFFGDQQNLGDRSGGDTTIEGSNFETRADCSVRTAVIGGNQTSSGSDANEQDPESSDCIRRLAINSDGANQTSDFAREESEDNNS